METWKRHCATLGVRENANPKEIRRAYRRLALARHPDQHGNSVRAKEDFQRLHESYEYLMSHTRPRPGPMANAPAGKATAVVPSRPPPPRTYARVWRHAAVACLVLTVFSVVLEKEEKGPPPLARWEREHGTLPYPLRVEEAPREAPKQNKARARPEAPAPTRTPQPAYPPEEKSAGPGAPHLAEEPYRAVCYMTVVMPENPQAQAIPNETQESCAARCEREVIAHPLGRVIRCAFAGRELVHYVPDPLDTFLARDPARADPNRSSNR